MNINFVSEPLGYLKNQPPHMLIIFLNRVCAIYLNDLLTQIKEIDFFIGVIQEKVDSIVKNLSVYTRNEMAMPSTNCGIFE